MLTLPRALSVLVVLFAAAAVSAQEVRPQAGQAFAQENCARCHAIGPTGRSPLAEAPALRDLHGRYPVDQLAEALAEGIGTGHAAMPEFQLEPAQIADLLAYLKTLQR
ncbi:c-type cytochrome [Falsiroseomonas sp.]|uniref:c-type cytochrome n=1 Tax=Falsiroseomonas sp. TaxID=2870721 RepID=UPI0035675AA3